MSTQFPDLFAALAATFAQDEVRARSQAGRQFHYITARTAMNRLDSVLGPENWWDEYTASENSVLCKLTVRLPDGTTLTKADAGGYAGMADSGDDEKSGYSDSFKRAAVKFGVGRYLYRDGVASFDRPDAPEPAQEPRQPDPAPPADGLPSQGRPPYSAQQMKAGENERSFAEKPANQGNGKSNGNGGPPRTGKALFAWTKDQEKRHNVGLLKYLNGWAKLQEFPGRMVDWDDDQVSQGHAEAVRKLQSVSNRGDAYEGD